ncbi:NAD(P)-dependent alcohol dehydrogenase [Streptomyces sp. SAJ15]|uniref:NAD(P)-dependent alcohol dehydrogenase n=1 Tax=Streptomyces sp. SAJ15 TaxID=2011095 RepID=UPI0011867356|nr:NAD(P)-dependent alcohol dehydrogenase [Streptomyces sp. SAJ15]TVL89174.1 alcohol dehydrogenase [Streptomyces sp. SAJ15]
MSTAVTAYAAPSPKAPLERTTIERRAPGEYDVVIEIAFTGICHTDIHQVHEGWAEGVFPMVPGHEIAGVVTAVGPGVTRHSVGDRVGVGCFVDSCRRCEYCRAGEEQFCREGAVWTYNARDPRTDEPTYGGYSTHIVVDENYVLRVPDGLSLDEAAPLMCAGITTYAPLARWETGPGSKVAVVGLGGLGHMAVKIGHARGAEVTVLSQSPRKKDDGLRLGADHFHATADPAVFTDLADAFDLILNTVSADLDLDAYLGLLRVDGAMVNVGLPETRSALFLSSLVMKRRSLAGSNIGGIRQTQEMLDFCARHRLAADVEVIPAEQINDAYERVVASDVRYRFVVDVASLRE